MRRSIIQAETKRAQENLRKLTVISLTILPTLEFDVDNQYAEMLLALKKRAERNSLPLLGYILQLAALEPEKATECVGIVATRAESDQFELYPAARK